MWKELTEDPKKLVAQIAKSPDGELPKSMTERDLANVLRSLAGGAGRKAWCVARLMKDFLSSSKWMDERWGGHRDKAEEMFSEFANQIALSVSSLLGMIKVYPSIENWDNANLDEMRWKAAAELDTKKPRRKVAAAEKPAAERSEGGETAAETATEGDRREDSNSNSNSPVVTRRHKAGSVQSLKDDFKISEPKRKLKIANATAALLYRMLKDKSVRQAGDAALTQRILKLARLATLRAEMVAVASKPKLRGKKRGRKPAVSLA